MSPEHRLDVCDLAAPEPLQKILTQLDTLEPAHFVHVIHRREPHCLFPLLDELGFDHAQTTDDRHVHIWIWNRTDSMAELEVQRRTAQP